MQPLRFRNGLEFVGEVLHRLPAAFQVALVGLHEEVPRALLPLPLQRSGSGPRGQRTLAPFLGISNSCSVLERQLCNHMLARQSATVRPPPSARCHRIPLPAELRLGLDVAHWALRENVGEVLPSTGAEHVGFAWHHALEFAREAGVQATISAGPQPIRDARLGAESEFKTKQRVPPGSASNNQGNLTFSPPKMFSAVGPSLKTVIGQITGMRRWMPSALCDDKTACAIKMCDGPSMPWHFTFSVVSSQEVCAISAGPTKRASMPLAVLSATTTAAAFRRRWL